ncbi:YcjF family protein [Rhodoligotrophos defluvii]|uniref:YcjF family protein n=1 Tax=Rhodoligotrophos defluvii TaxID=2561934 RepID=UPI0010C9596C|nr:TIGR01620 family protein [Rhodoligotrophos defluvii]
MSRDDTAPPRPVRQPRVFTAPPPPPPPPPPSEQPEVLRHLAGRRKGIRWGALFLSSVGGLITMAIGYSAYRFVEDLFARQDWLGWLAFSLAVLAGVAAISIILREIWGLSRLAKMGEIRTIAERAIRQDSASDAASTVGSLRSLYSGRRDMAQALTSFAEYDREIMDPRDRVKLAERMLMSELDRDAAGLIARSARRISILTAVTPAAVLDVLFVGAQNLVMLRGLATLYGARPHLLGTIKLTRMVVTHLAVTGSIAFSDTVLQHIIGRGIAGRISARLGEGAVNGIMTARIGLAAMDVVRPLPFETLRRPSLSSIAGRIGDVAGTPDEDGPEQSQDATPHGTQPQGPAAGALVERDASRIP